MKLTIEKLGGRGMGIARLEGKIVMIPRGVPGDHISLKKIKEKKNYLTAEIDQVILPSKDRITPDCSHFGPCGGCAHRNMTYSSQCHWKDQLITEIFRNGLPTSRAPLTPSPETRGYRNKMHLQCRQLRGKLVTGYYTRENKELVAIRQCLHCPEKMNLLARFLTEELNRRGIKAFDSRQRKGQLKDIILHESEEGLMVTLISGQRKIPRLQEVAAAAVEKFPELKGFYLYFNPHPGDIAFRDNARLDKSNLSLRLIPLIEGYLKTNLAGLTFTLSPLTFFQVNKGQTERIISCLKEILKDTRGILIDAYAGTGTLSLPLAEKFKEVHALELVKHSLEIGEENCRENRISNFRFHPGDALEELKKLVIDQKDPVHLLLDPPRGGLSLELGNYIKENPRFETILYLSCDPHTQVRDVERICSEGNYTLEYMAPFDMFPHTFHIENLCLLQRSRLSFKTTDSETSKE